MPNRDALRARAASGLPLILDGGLATELEARGHDLNDPLWSARLLIEDPDALRSVHRAYVEAGAECVITASYQAALDGLQARGCWPKEAAALLAGSVTLARESGARFVAASVGPYGAALANGAEYTGDYPGMDESGLREWHARRFEILANAGADVLACETIPNATEARALASLAEAFPEVPVWFSFSCQDGERLRDGTSLQDVARDCARAPNVLAIGVNCTAPRFVDSLIAELRAASDTPIVVYPNSGEDYDAARRTWAGENDARNFGNLAMGWRSQGARLIGGCCRTGPEHIRLLARTLCKTGG
jgi:homocysteine S-methyltransferase